MIRLFLYLALRNKIKFIEKFRNNLTIFKNEELGIYKESFCSKFNILKQI